MIRKTGLCCACPLAAVVLIGLTVLAGAGCSGEPSAAVSDAGEPFTESELAEMRKSARNQSEFRELKRRKLAERAGANIVETKSPPGKPKAK